MIIENLNTVSNLTCNEIMNTALKNIGNTEGHVLWDNNITMLEVGAVIDLLKRGRLYYTYNPNKMGEKMVQEVYVHMSSVLGKIEVIAMVGRQGCDCRWYKVDCILNNNTLYLDRDMQVVKGGCGTLIMYDLAKDQEQENKD